MDKKRYLSKLNLTIYLFFFLFSPPLIPHINFIFILTLYSLFMLIKNYKIIKEVIYRSTLNKFIVGILIFLCYWIIIIILNFFLGNSVNWFHYVRNAYSFFLFFPVTIICVLYVIVECQKNKFTLDDLIKYFIFAGMIQAALVLLSLVFPSIKNFFVEIMYLNTGNNLLNTPWLTQRRFYGFSNSMLDLFGLGTGLIAALALFYSFHKNIKYIFLFPVLLMVPLFNARTGLVIAFVGVIFVILYLVTNLKKGSSISIIKILSIIFTFIILALVVLLASIFFPETFDWISKSFKTYLDVFSGNTNGKADAFLLFSSNFWMLPPFPEIIFGTGYSLYEATGFAHSDVGYINDIWCTGILGTIILYYTFGRVCYKAFKSSTKKIFAYMIVYFVVSIMLFLVKGRIWVYSPAMAVILTILFYTIYLNSFSKEKSSINDAVDCTNLQSLITIIVPVYKVEKYLKKCIDSIINQDYKNLEIILVDDGSPDICPEICDEYAKKDERIRVVHKENGGLSDARNAGIKVATGEYIAFIDSDDYVAENYISMLLYTLKKYDADISACNYIKVYEDTGRQEVELKTDKELVMTNVEAMKDLFILPSNSDVVTWNKLYRTSLFTDNNIEFPKGKLHEDNFTTYKLYYYSSKVAFVNVPCYYYLQRKDSIMGQKFNPRRLDILLALQEIKKFVKKNNIDLEQEIKFNELLILLGLLNSMIDTNCVDDKVFEDIRNRIIKDKREYLNSPYLRTKNKLAIYSLQTGKGAYTLVRKLFVLKNKLK